MTPETSLIVLETLSDYQRYEIVPPPGALRDAYDAASRSAAAAKSAQSARHLSRLVERYREVQAWWDKDFPKGKPAPQLMAPADRSAAACRRCSRVRGRRRPPPRSDACAGAWPGRRRRCRRRASRSQTRRRRAGARDDARRERTSSA